MVGWLTSKKMEKALLLCACVVLVAVGAVGAEDRCPLLLASAGANTTGCYVVVLKKGSSPSTFEMVESKLVNMSKDGRLYGSVRSVSQAVTVSLNQSALDKVSGICKCSCLLY